MIDTLYNGITTTIKRLYNDNYSTLFYEGYILLLK